MKHLFYLSLFLLGIMGCSSDNSTKNTSEVDSDTSNVSEGKMNAEADISYEALDKLLARNQPIYGDYLQNGSEISISGSLNNHSILQETNDYVLVKSTNGGTDVLQFYLSIFSKETGILIDFISVGTEAEGVDPYKITWLSPSSFSTVDYQYELLEDEESGAYIKGSLLDSTVLNYNISSSGLIVLKD